MKNTAAKLNPFETHAVEYDKWFEKYPFVFQSEVEALRNMLPIGQSRGIEVGLGTGRFSVALGLKEGVEPAEAMRKIAIGRGLEVLDAKAERLPYKDMQFDFVLMVSCISYLTNLHSAFRQAHRVLKRGGALILGFIPKNSKAGMFYEKNRDQSLFYKQANFYSESKIADELQSAGFKNLIFTQTLFKNPGEINEFEPAIPGSGKGSFVVIKAIRK